VLPRCSRELELMAYKERLRTLGLLGLVERRLRGGSNSSLHLPEGVAAKRMKKLLLVVADV